MTARFVPSTWGTSLLLLLMSVSGVASAEDLCAINNVNQLMEAPATVRVAPSYPTPVLRKNVSG